MVRDINLEHNHFNRILEVIKNSKNNNIHVESIYNMIVNFISIFGESKLSRSLEISRLKLKISLEEFELVRMKNL